MTGTQLVQKYFPEMDEDGAGYILWNQTCFPFGTRTEIEKNLVTLKTTLDAKQTPCDGCNEPATEFSAIFSYCNRCNAN